MSENDLVSVGRREIIWFGVSGALLIGLLYIADFGKFTASLRRADTSLFAAALAAGLSSLLVWSWVWHRFLGEVGIDATVSQTVRMFLAGNFLNSITPLGQFGGEPVMAYVVSDVTDSSYESSLACVVSADVLNATPFFTFILGGVLYLGISGSLRGPLVDIATLAIVLLCLLALVTYLLWSEEAALWDGLVRLIDAADERFGWTGSLFESARESLEEVDDSFQEAGDDARFLLLTATFSHLAIVMQIVSLYFVFWSLGLPTRLVPIYLIVNLSVIATLSPTPGGAGTYEAAFSGLTTLLYPVDLATAVTAAVLFRLTTYWPGIFIGGVALLSLRDDAEKRRTE